MSTNQETPLPPTQSQSRSQISDSINSPNTTHFNNKNNYLVEDEESKDFDQQYDDYVDDVDVDDGADDDIELQLTEIPSNFPIKLIYKNEANDIIENNNCFLMFKSNNSLDHITKEKYLTYILSVNKIYQLLNMQPGREIILPLKNYIPTISKENSVFFVKYLRLCVPQECIRLSSNAFEWNRNEKIKNNLILKLLHQLCQSFGPESNKIKENRLLRLLKLKLRDFKNEYEKLKKLYEYQKDTAYSSTNEKRFIPMIDLPKRDYTDCHCGLLHLTAIKCPDFITAKKLQIKLTSDSFFQYDEAAVVTPFVLLNEDKLKFLDPEIETHITDPTSLEFYDYNLFWNESSNIKFEFTREEIECDNGSIISIEPYFFGLLLNWYSCTKGSEHRTICSRKYEDLQYFTRGTIQKLCCRSTFREVIDELGFLNNDVENIPESIYSASKNFRLRVIASFIDLRYMDAKNVIIITFLHPEYKLRQCFEQLLDSVHIDYFYDVPFQLLFIKATRELLEMSLMLPPRC